MRDLNNKQYHLLANPFFSFIHVCIQLLAVSATYYSGFVAQSVGATYTQLLAGNVYILVNN